jgi:hypothetical protein
MRSVSPGVFLETKYPGVMVGAVASHGRLLLVDAPIRVEDGREWVSQLNEKGKPRFMVLLLAGLNSRSSRMTRRGW